ncbi:major capsid protein [Halomonas sp. OfavH-34-E]|uniref:major capsid protein n=1 Tax=Halomonas sp. OfavH-34-E TaxID=2954491 RepID=UPI00209760AD|nr:major capsid protein [Halomonas sp. OfavH-34-E]MCO7218108.1 major capsid protein [Halomonas sp. OfavH-34-E]
MALSDMKVFNDFLYSAATETIRQQIELFNAATGGALQLQQAGNVGDFANEASYKAIANLMRRRNAYGTGAVTPTTLAQMDHVAVKIAGGTSPVEFQPQQFQWIQRQPEEAGVVIGEQVARGVIADEVNTAILALQTAMIGNSAVAHDATAGTLNLNALNKGAGKFGDRMMDIMVWVLHSKPMTDLFDGALTNGNQLFEFGTVRVTQDGFGRRFVMTDSPALYEADGGGAGTDHYHTLGLAEGAAVVEDNNDYYATVEEKTGDENIRRIFQAEYTYNLGLKGYSYGGTKSPDDATIGTGGNWSQIASDVKDTAGVIVTSL